MKNLKNALLTISGIGLLIYLYKLFTSSPPAMTPFPQAAEKAVAEKEVSQLKEEIEELGQKEYSDEEILKKFQ